MAKVISPFESLSVVGDVNEERLGGAVLALLRSGCDRVSISPNFKPGFDPADIETAKKLRRQHQPKLLASPDRVNGDSEMRVSDQKVLSFFQKAPDTEFPPRFVIKSTKLAQQTVTACIVRLMERKLVIKTGFGKYKLNGEQTNA